MNIVFKVKLDGIKFQSFALRISVFADRANYKILLYIIIKIVSPTLQFTTLLYYICFALWVTFKLPVPLSQHTMLHLLQPIIIHVRVMLREFLLTFEGRTKT